MRYRIHWTQNKIQPSENMMIPFPRRFPIVALVICLLSFATHAQAAFDDGLLRDSESAHTTVKNRESNLNTLINAHATDYPDTTFCTATSCTKTDALNALDEFIALMKKYRTRLNFVYNLVNTRRTAINAESDSISPYTDTNLMASHAKVKQNALPNLQKVLDMAKGTGKGVDRFNEIISDGEKQRANVVAAQNTVQNQAAVTQAITEAVSELVEADNDSKSQLDEVKKMLTEAKTAFELDFANVASDFDAMSNPSPAFTTYINAFRGRW